MRIHGLEEFEADLARAEAELVRESQAHVAFTARTFARDAVANMSRFRIGLVTGRSRALLGWRLGAGVLRGSSSVSAIAGYLTWPSDVEFYPTFLNNGTRHQSAKPYFDQAFEQARPVFEEGMDRILDRFMERLAG